MFKLIKQEGSKSIASIVQWNKSFSVVYTIYVEGKKKQRWETYHSYKTPLSQKRQLDLVQPHKKERAQCREEKLKGLEAISQGKLFTIGESLCVTLIYPISEPGHF